jgi:hypothetical protein
LVVIVSAPVAVPDTVGSNEAWMEMYLPGYRVTGNEPPVLEKPWPVAVTDLMMIGPVPEDVMVIVFDERVFSETVPNDTLVGFTVNRRVLANAGIDTDKSRSIATEIDGTNLGFAVPEGLVLVVVFEAGLTLKFDRQLAR